MDINNFAFKVMITLDLESGCLNSYITKIELNGPPKIEGQRSEDIFRV